MARQASTERRHHKHSKHKHKHKHKRGHHHHHHHHHSGSKHKKKKGKDRERETGKRKDETPEIRVDERELQTALETLEEAILEQCVRSDTHSSTEETSDVPPSPLTPSTQPQKAANVHAHEKHVDHEHDPVLSEVCPTTTVVSAKEEVPETVLRGETPPKTASLERRVDCANQPSERQWSDRVSPLSDRVNPSKKSERVGQLSDRNSRSSYHVSPSSERVSDNVSRSSDHVSPSSERVSQVSDRVSQPSDRVSPSSERVSQVSDRVSQPSDRVSPSSERVSQLSDRVNQPSDCVSPSSERVSQFSDRVSRSSDRVSQLSDRVSQLSDRVNQPSDRVTPSAERVSQLSDHVNQPSDRVTPSAERVSQLSDRVSQPSDRVSPSSERVSQLSDHVNQPSDRVTPSAERVSQLSDRVSQSSDHVSLSSDHGSQLSDRVSRSSDRVSQLSDRVSQPSDRVSLSSERVSQLSDRVSPPSDHITHDSSEDSDIGTPSPEERREKPPIGGGWRGEEDTSGSNRGSPRGFWSESETSSSDSDDLQLGRDLKGRGDKKNAIQIKIGGSLLLGSKPQQQSLPTATTQEKMSSQRRGAVRKNSKVAVSSGTTRTIGQQELRKQHSKDVSVREKLQELRTKVAKSSAAKTMTSELSETKDAVSEYTGLGEKRKVGMEGERVGRVGTEMEGLGRTVTKEEEGREGERVGRVGTEMEGVGRTVTKEEEGREGERVGRVGTEMEGVGRTVTKEEEGREEEDSEMEGEGSEEECGGSFDEMRGRRRSRKHSRHSDHHKKRKSHKKPSKRERHSLSVSRSSSDYSRSPSRSRRSGSHSRRKHRSLSPVRRRSRSHSRSRSRSRSPYHSRRRQHRSRSPYRSGMRNYHHNRTRSPYRSTSGYSRKRSDRYSRSRSKSPYHKRRRRRSSRSRNHSKSRSRSPYHRQRRRRSNRARSHSKSRSRSPYHRRRRRQSYYSSKSRSPEVKGSRVEGENVVDTVVREVAAKVKEVSITRYTALCKDLQKKQEREDEGGELSEPEPETDVRAPFKLSATPAYQSGLILHNNIWKTPNQLITENNVLQTERPLATQFPVSCGLDHQMKENTYGAPEDSQENKVFTETKSVSMGELMIQRLEASQRLQQNPQDLEAQQILAYVEHQAAAWAGSQIKPGQFTGKKQLNPLTREDHNIGMQAWAKKDMFKGLAPVLSGFGMKMMKKMGWDLGQPLGRMGKGVTEPIPMSVKVDRAGLSSPMDKAQPIVPASAIKASSTKSRAAHLVEGKHPVSALQEICAKKHWDPPHYELVTNTGPSHHMTFRYKVILPSGSFQPAEPSPTKKQAKTQAALACLQGLGFVENVL